MFAVLPVLKIALDVTLVGACGYIVVDAIRTNRAIRTKLNEIDMTKEVTSIDLQMLHAFALKYGVIKYGDVERVVQEAKDRNKETKNKGSNKMNGEGGDDDGAKIVN